MRHYNGLLPSDGGELTTIRGYNARHYKEPGANFSVASALAARNPAEGTRSVYIRTESGNTYYLDLLRGTIVSLKESLKGNQIIARPIRKIVPDITCGEGFAYEAVEVSRDGTPVGVVRAHTSPVAEIIALEDGPSATIGLGLTEEQDIPFVREYEEARNNLLPHRAQWV